MKIAQPRSRNFQLSVLATRRLRACALDDLRGSDLLESLGRAGRCHTNLTPARR